MSNLQAAVRAFATDAAQPAELCQQVNRILCGRIAEGALHQLLLLRRRLRARPADVRQRRPLRARSSCAPTAASSGSPPAAPVLGVFPDATYGQERVSIGSGDRAGALHRRHHRGPRREPTRSSARTAWWRSRGEHRACSAPALQARITDTVSAFTGRPFPGRRDADRDGGRLALGAVAKGHRPGLNQHCERD